MVITGDYRSPLNCVLLQVYYFFFSCWLQRPPSVRLVLMCSTWESCWYLEEEFVFCSWVVCAFPSKSQKRNTFTITYLSRERCFCSCRTDLPVPWFRHCLYIELRESRLDLQREMRPLSPPSRWLLVISSQWCQVLGGEQRNIQRIRIKNLKILISFVLYLPIPTLFPTALL